MSTKKVQSVVPEQLKLPIIDSRTRHLDKFSHYNTPGSAARSMVRLAENISVIDGINMINTDVYKCGVKIKTKSTRLDFIKNHNMRECDECGRPISHFNIEIQIGELDMPHGVFILNPYIINELGFEIQLNWDHIFPQAFGGSNSTSNSRLCCVQCNSSKGHEITDKVIAQIWAKPEMINKSSLVKALKINQVPGNRLIFKKLYLLGCFDHIQDIENIIKDI